MNILYIPQFSMTDNKTFFVDKDGAFLVLKTFLKYLKEYLKHHPDKQFDVKVLIPMPEKTTETVFDDEINDIYQSTKGLYVWYSATDFEFSPILNRYNFNTSEWRKRLKNMDAVVNNIPEISRNIRAVLGDKKIPLVSCHHFPDYLEENQLVTNWANGDKFSYFWRQLDGMISSDLNVFNCESSLLGWRESVRGALNADLGASLLNNLTYTPYTDLSDYTPSTDEKYEEFTAVFPARITESLYTNWQKVFELFSDAKTRGKVIVCNPSGQKGLDVLKKLGYLDKLELHSCGNYYSKNKKIYVSKGMERNQYIEVCSKSHAGICLYEYERYGGIAIREVMGYGQGIPIVLNRNECANWFRHQSTLTTLNSVSELTPKRYNQLTDIYNTGLHANILDNFKANEHYMRYYKNFERIAEVLCST